MSYSDNRYAKSAFVDRIGTSAGSAVLNNTYFALFVPYEGI